ncbi:GRIP1-associated protein 1-like isoform X2 [Tachypleus tridentatus]|uniref:GRIP1-associated protein 1-like isoform X2 n=1 Tax=Tachypleus tridentatus TaxID=6853 RepID=UPI003FD0967A
MAALLSDDDFQRLQTQLLDLRSKNYSLEETNRKQQNELGQFQHKIEDLEKELSKAQKVINRSKKAKDVEQLLQENESLQLKLQSQEDEFRLQNSTLMHELASVVSMNEKLEKQLEESMSEKRLEDGENDSNEIRRLQAENMALQKSLLESREKYEVEISSLKKLVLPITVKVHTVTTESVRTPASMLVRENISDEVEGSPEKMSCQNLKVLLNEAESVNNNLKKQLQELSGAKLSLDIEVEEKNMLKKQMAVIQASQKEEVERLKEEICKLTEKLKRKQESFLQLQEEKEILYIENRKAYDSLQAVKDKEIQQLQDMVQRLQSQLNTSFQNLEDIRTKANSRVQELEQLITCLQDQGLDGNFTEHVTMSKCLSKVLYSSSKIQHSQVRTQSPEIVEELQTEKIALESSLAESQQLMEELQKENENLSSQLKESQIQVENLLKELDKALDEKNKAETSCSESLKQAEKRKVLLDEMAVHLQETADHHTQETVRLKEEFSHQIEELKSLLETEKKRSRDLEQYQWSTQSLEEQVTLLRSEKKVLEENLKEREKTLENTKLHFEGVLAQKQQEHIHSVNCLQEEMESQVKDLTLQLEISQAQCKEFEEKIVKLKQDIKDILEDRKIQEKKGLAMVKELKKQLQQERRRAEKLQDRLQDVLDESTPTESMDDIIQPRDATDRHKGDTSSISSWSLMSGGNLDSSREHAAVTSSSNEIVTTTGGQSSARTTPTLLEQENNDLLSRIAGLQQEKWNMEEKINHLEVSNAALADDLVKKTEIIQYYCMEGRAEHHHITPHDKLTVKRVVDFIKDKGDENLREINRRMQRMLEETLIKNMHLQQDLEKLSNEVINLTSKKQGMGQQSLKGQARPS